MAIVTSKMEILVDLNKPVEEIQVCIAAIVNFHHGMQMDILRQTDMWLGEQIERLEEDMRNQQIKAEQAIAELKKEELKPLK